MAAAQAAQAAGADLIGFVFAPSRRRISPEAACRIACQVKGIGKVGVFVDAPLNQVREIAEKCNLDYVQLHGQESPEYCRGAGRPVIKGIRVKAELKLAEISRYAVDWILCDSFIPGKTGGTGVSFDWKAAGESCRQIKSRLLLAGGLTEANVTEAIRLFEPAGVDVSGGVETNGIKDIGKIRRFIAAAKTAGGKPNVISSEDC
ncbi:MAG: phosphoribosylanthranilate isomerase [Veillonellales bacterium]